MTTKQLESAVFGGGCFWCVEAVYQKIKGVVRVKSGYMGGHLASPSYEAVCTKTTGHAEVVRIDFDPEQVSYLDLLDVFFGIHDPTTLDRQGDDIGPQYRSVIFATTAAQMTLARAAIDLMAHKPVDAAPTSNALIERLSPRKRSQPAVTQLVDASGPGADDLVASATRPVELAFWPAEELHDNYFNLHPNQGYCAMVVAPKVTKVEKEFKALIVQ